MEDWLTFSLFLLLLLSRCLFFSNNFAQLLLSFRFFLISLFIAIYMQKSINFEKNVGKTSFQEEMCICRFYIKIQLKTGIIIGCCLMESENRLDLSCLVNLKVLLSVLKPTGLVPYFFPNFNWLEISLLINFAYKRY